MIKANELRIGNYIKYADGSRCKLSSNGIHQIDMGFYKAFGIPLTAEILEEAGFTISLNNPNIYLLRIGDTNFMLSDRKDGRFYSSPSIIPCKYLHQLQNMYHALTGEELEITLKPQT